MKKVTLKLITHCRDCGDGSNSVSFFNNEEELLQDFNENRDMEFKTFEELKDFCYDDPYNNGSIVKREVDLRILDDGTVELDRSFSVNSDG